MMDLCGAEGAWSQGEGNGSTCRGGVQGLEAQGAARGSTYQGRAGD